MAVAFMPWMALSGTRLTTNSPVPADIVGGVLQRAGGTAGRRPKPTTTGLSEKALKKE